MVVSGFEGAEEGCGSTDVFVVLIFEGAAAISCRLSGLFANSVFVDRFLDPRWIFSDKEVDIGGIGVVVLVVELSSAIAGVDLVLGLSSGCAPLGMNIACFVCIAMVAMDGCDLGFFGFGSSDFDLLNVLASDSDPIEKPRSDVGCLRDPSLGGASISFTGCFGFFLFVFRGFPSNSDSNMRVVSVGGGVTLCLFEIPKGFEAFLPIADADADADADGRRFILAVYEIARIMQMGFSLAD